MNKKELIDMLEVLVKVSVEKAIKEHLNKIVKRIESEGIETEKERRKK